MIKFRIKRQGEIKEVVVPDSWHEVSTRQWLEIEQNFEGKEIDLIKLFSILSNLSIEQVEEITDDKIEVLLYEAVQFVYDDNFKWDQLTRPEKILLNGRLVRVPTKGIGSMPLGLKVLLNQFIATQTSTVKLLVSGVALYLQTAITGDKFNRDKHEEIEGYILDAPATQVYPIGSFFLSNRKILIRLGELGFLKRIQIKSKSLESSPK